MRPINNPPHEVRTFHDINNNNSCQNAMIERAFSLVIQDTFYQMA